MTSQRSFVRKVTYFSLIGVLLLPLYWLSLPATSQSAGGKLARIRKENNLSQANLGQIDPTSATMKLSTFGLHGIATTLLWSKATYAKEAEDWTTFSAALEQIMNLQPHFVKVWQYQAWNVAFNQSFEFDDYRDRYHYVIKGIKLLERGIRFNDCNPRMLRELAHFISFKIGKSDEAALYRPMFANDKGYHGTDRMAGTRYEGRPQSLTDSWLLAKWWYQWSDRLLDTKQAEYTTLAPVVVHNDAPHMQIEYARAREEEGHLDEVSLDAWRQAADEWDQFGLRLLPTTQGFSIRLKDLDRQHRQTLGLQSEFEKMIETEPNLRQRVLEARRAKLSEQERAVLDKPEVVRTPAEQSLAGTASGKLILSSRDLAMELSQPRREQALRLAERLEVSQRREFAIDRDRGVVNYEYWQIRCEVERRPETVAARKAIYEGDKAYAASNLKGALEKYTTGIAGWKKVIDRVPMVLNERMMVEELMKVIEKYRRILKQNGRTIPVPFDLQIVLDVNEALRKQDEAHTAPAAGE